MENRFKQDTAKAERKELKDALYSIGLVALLVIVYMSLE